MIENQILEIFLKTNALLNGHFLLTSGRHSNQYFQCALVLQYPEYNEFICSLIANHFRSFNIDVVISPAIGGIVVGQEVARQLNKKSIFAEREDKSLSLRRGFQIEEGKRYLICEDVVTTGGSVFEVMEIVRNNGGIVAGVGYIVDRSNNKVNFGVPQFSTLQLDVVSYLPEECPLCKENKIPLIKPGSRKINP
ncbi:orotate phosphoribosyltransferase [Rosettibacter firmus]|uniref:orotate phosphoribosyltransferase n=1 Tax=Rosettibacter firmus TaxID=3111522 RepID=UPI00336C1BCB